MDSADHVRARLNSLHEAVWELAAVALALRDPGMTDPEQHRAAERVLLESGLLLVEPGGIRPTSGLVELAGGNQARVGAQAAAGILQSAALLTGASTWT